MKIAIVGGGLSGLACAHYLSDSRDHSVTVLEAEPQFGGRANLTEDGEHCTRLFLQDYAYLFALLNEIPGPDGTVAQSLARCRRFARTSAEAWVELNHVYTYGSRGDGLSAREKLAISKANRDALVASKRMGSRTSNRYGSIWNWSPPTFVRVLASLWRSGNLYALPGATDRYLVNPWVEHLTARGVTLRAGVQVERLATDATGVDLWLNGTAERFDVAIVTAFATDAYALLDRSGVARPLDHRTHTHCKCVTLDLDPREPLLAEPDTRVYACAGITTVVQPRECRCVSVAAFSASTDTDAIVAEVCSHLELEHPPLRVRARENLGSGEAVFVGDYVDPVLLAAPLERRVYFAGSYVANSYPVDSAEGACRTAHNALVRVAADHPTVRPRSNPALPAAEMAPGRFSGERAHPNSPPDERLARGVWWLSRRASALVTRTAADLEFIDLSETTWPLAAPAIFVANHRSVFDAPAGVLTFDRLRVFPRIVVQRQFFDRASAPHLKAIGALPALRGTNATVTAAVAALTAGDSVAFMVEGRLTPRDVAEHAPHGRGAALAALRTNALIVPIAAHGTDDVWPTPRPWPLLRRERPKVVVVVGKPFHPETSSLEALMDDMRRVLLGLEELARERACGLESRPLEVVA